MSTVFQPKEVLEITMLFETLYCACTDFLHGKKKGKMTVAKSLTMGSGN